MVKPTRQLFEFGPFRIDPLKRLLLRGGQPVQLTPKAFDILLVLIQNDGEVLDKDELMKAVWPDTVVEENNLTRNVSALRKALGESPGEHRYVVTIPGRGYQFVADVRGTASEESAFLSSRTQSRVVIDDKESDPPAGGSISDRVVAAAEKVASLENGQVQEATSAASIYRKKPFVLATVLAIVVATVAIWLYSTGITRLYLESSKSPIAIAQITHSGNAGDAALSPDGKYVAYRLIEAGRQSVWLRHLPTGSSQQIVPPTDAQYQGLSFSPDGSQIYFVRSEKSNPLRILYLMPLLGGVPTRLIADVNHAPSFSPDGRKLVFSRVSLSESESMLVIANSDGTGEQRLASRRLSDPFSHPAWSPDGRVIVCAVGSGELGGDNVNLVQVRVDDGSQQNIGEHKWRAIRDVAWLTDGSALVVTGSASAGRGLWRVTYPRGEVTRLTNDLNSYIGLSLAPGANCLVTTKTALESNIWTVPIGGRRLIAAGAARRITFGASNYHRVSFLPNGRLIYACSASSAMDIWEMNPDGTGQKQLTSGNGANWHQSASPDGRYIVFVSDRSGANNIWRMDSDGSNPVPLTRGGAERFPDCSPDGKWVVYTSVGKDRDFFTLWKVSIDGGEPVQLTETHSLWPAVSPDGKWIAYFFRDAQSDSHYKLTVIPFEGGPPVMSYEPRQVILSPYLVRWTPDGRALTYAADNNGISNIWSQPIDGGQPIQLTDFNSDQLLSFDWARDGRQIVCSRGAWTGDVVLISNFN